MALLKIGRDQTSLSGSDGTIDVDLPLTNPNEPLPPGGTARLTFRPFGSSGAREAASGVRP